MKLSLITKIVQNARGMIERALERKELEKPRLSQNPPAPEIKLKNIVKKSHFEQHFEVQEADAFRVKAIILLQPYKVYNSIQEKISSLQLAPLFTHKDTERNQITLSQVLLPFPGERIELIGTFQRNDIRTIPIANSFKLRRIPHSGYPHPAQHMGWAFTHAFIKDKSRLESIKKELLPGERLRQNAKDWVGAKKRYFEMHKLELCPHLKQFIETLCGCTSPIIDAFFEEAMNRNDCYDFLSITHAKVHESQESHKDLSGYQTLILSALTEKSSSTKFQVCAEFELSHFIDCLEKKPLEELEFVNEIKSVINKEIDLLIKS